MSKPQPKLNQKKRASLQQASIIIFMGIAAVIMLALLTYNRELDPGPFFSKPNHTGGCANLAGCKGAWVADFLYGLLGYLSFAVPIVLVVLGLTAFRHPKHLRNPNNPIGGVNTVITMAGALMTLLAGSGLAHMLFSPGIGGGLLGTAVAGVFINSFLGFYGSLLLFLAMFIGGVTLVADIPWGDLTEKVGDFTLQLFERMQGSKAHSRESQAFDDKESAPESGVLSVGKDFLKSGKSSAGGMLGGMGSGLLDKVKAAVGLDKSYAGEKDLYDERDPLFDARDADDDGRQDKVVFADKAEDAASNSEATAKAANKQKAEPKKAQQPVKKFDEPEEQFDLALHDSDQIITLPRLSLLNAPPPARDRPRYSKKELSSMSDNIVESLRHYNVGKGDDPVRVVNCEPGPVITRFELQLPDGTKASKVSGLANDLARNLCVSSVRVVEVIPGRPTIGLEIPNEQRDVVAISEILNSDVFRNSRSPLTLALGKDISGKPIVADLARMPHLLVAGTTGSGKSVAVNAMLMSLLYKSTPEEVKLILIDPKMLELSSYENIPHLLAPVVTDMKEAASALRWCVAEMERRYLLMSKLRVRNIAGFNAKVREAQDRDEDIPDPLFDPLKSMDTHPQPLEPLPYIVIVIDEFADMMMIVGKKVEELIARLAQKARAAGIHLILATQRPSVDVITGLIKANIPSRIAFQVSTKIDSRTILDQGGAEQLLGYGDMLYMPPGTSMPQRVHGALVTDQEVEDVATYLKQQMEPDYVEGVLADTGNADGIPGLEPLSNMGEEADPLYDEAVAIVTESRRASISYLQRRLKVGYNRAARMIEDMEVAGVVSPVQGNGSREVLAPPPIQA